MGNNTHDFDIKQGFNNITILFCQRCGKSYSLTQYQSSGICAWVEMPFMSGYDKRIDPPVTPCNEREY